MAVFHTLAAIGRFIRKTPPPPVDLLEAYAHEVIPVLDRAEWLYEHWLEQSTLFTDGEKLGNVAAIHRWETATMGRSLERVIPPSVLADAHERVVDALEMASRAAQLLSNGSRFHNANAVCEGQAMLAVSRERRLDALKSMRRYLSRVQAAAGPEATVASSEMLPETAGPVVLDGNLPGNDSPIDHPAADGPPVDGPTLEAASADAEQTVMDGGADPGTRWPEGAELDLVLTDAAEPEPAWLSAARSSADQSETTADRPAEQAAPPTGPTEQVDAAEVVDGPVDTPGLTPAPDPPTPDASVSETSARRGGVGDPADRGGWGSLFAGPPGQPDR